jgi:hypothetical protein
LPLSVGERRFGLSFPLDQIQEKETVMTDPTIEAGSAGHVAKDEDQAIRERVRELTSQVLQRGRVDTEGVKEVVLAMTGGRAGQASQHDDEAREAFAEAIKGLDEALYQSAEAAHATLGQLAAKGKDYSDNDLKEALVHLRKLQEDYVAIAARIADAASGHLRHELIELAMHAQRVSADAGARAAAVMNEFATSMGSGYRERANSGVEAARTYGTRMAMLVSGVLAGVADALREQASAKKPE